MKSDISQDVILFDWLTVTCKTSDPSVWMKFLDMESVDWSPLERGRNGYKAGYYFGSISILYDGAENMGVCLDMSGQGCRSFEEFGSGDFIGLFSLILSNTDFFNITRLDVAFDDHSGILDMQRIWDDTFAREYVSKFTKCEAQAQLITGKIRNGCTVYFGSRKSAIRVRIYDKAFERGKEDQHWIRVEMQLRDDRALDFIRQSAPIGEVFRGVLYNYVRFVEEDYFDSNRWRWEMKPYWAELLNGIGRIRIFEKPGIEYNAAQLDHFAFDMAGPAMKCAIELYGAPFVLHRILDIDISENLKYKKLIQQYGCKSSKPWDLPDNLPLAIK